MKVRIIEKRPVAAGVETFVFEPDQSVQWRPGYYWKLTFAHDGADDRGTERWFTISAPSFERRPTITTRVDGHPMSSFKQHLEVGAEMEAEEPEGDFVLNDLDGDYVFLAGGIGITPFHSMLKQFDHDGKMPKIQLLYGNRSQDIPFRAEFDLLAAKYPQLTIDYLVEPERLSLETIKKYIRPLHTPTFYVSGPEPMVEALEKDLKEMGVPEAYIKTDFFPGYTKI